MADAADTVATATTSAAAESASKPKAAEPKRWADEEDDVPEEPSSSSEGKTVAELNVDALSIDEKTNKFLDEPEDSNIRAVRSLYLDLSHADKCFLPFRFLFYLAFNRISVFYAVVLWGASLKLQTAIQISNIAVL